MLMHRNSTASSRSCSLNEVPDWALRLEASERLDQGLKTLKASRYSLNGPPATAHLLWSSQQGSFSEPTSSVGTEGRQNTLQAAACDIIVTTSS